MTGSLAWMNDALLAAGSFGLLLTFFVVVRLLPHHRNGFTDMESEIEESGFSAERYHPMARLLDESDFEFLKAQPGYRPEIGAKLRRERRQIFRMYLGDLSRDFRRLHAEARRMLAHSPDHRAELVEMLIRQQITFWSAMVRVELSLVGLGKANITDFVQAMVQMHTDLSRLSAPALM